MMMMIFRLIEDASKYREYVVILYRVCSACCTNTIYWFNSLKLHLKNLPSDAYRVVVNADRTPPGQHPRRYNAPTANEVAVVLAGNQFGSRDIVLHQRDNLLKHVSDTHRFYDALQYPLIFWKGQEGYSFHIPQIDPNTRQPLSSKVSSMDFYGYSIMVRRNSPNVIVQFGQLFNQFLVDMYAKVENERLRYLTLLQRNLRAESYIHLRNALSTDANINPNSLGQRIILPSSFVNSPRSWQYIYSIYIKMKCEIDVCYRITQNLLTQSLWNFACMPSHRRRNLSQRSNSSRVQHAYRLRETRGQNIRRLRAQSARQAAVRSLETPDPIHSRLQAHSEIYSSTRRNTRTNNFFSSVWSSMENAGFNYSVAVEYFKHPLISLGMMDTTCRFC
ncbi:hypothetical protein LAZ67_14001678 [Cordylochernes scorpioides]|uniref:Helitron helicase-like domain-containing protein n=1 Tax=Cordylochernes scorpioides TaxID=51811 RepID=A0ABY6L6N7_9ARAC|nr:hypothetical protein LAZ67_14001678 [Cordylochernes scorpioides]